MTNVFTPVAVGRVLQRLLVRQRIPVVLGVSVVRPSALVGIQNSSERRSNDNLLDTGSALLDRLQNASRTNDGGVKQLLLDIGYVEVERARGVNDSFKWRIRLDSLVESTLLRNVFHDREIKLVLAIAWVSFLDLIGLFLAADGGDDGMTVRL